MDALQRIRRDNQPAIIGRKREERDDPWLALLPDEIERNRYRNILESLQPYAHLFRGQRVLDFGASWGTSLVAMLRLGARDAIGVEPDCGRVEKGLEFLNELGYPAYLRHVADTRRLSFLRDGEFGFVLAQAVFEHIPQPRDQHLREVWRVVAPAGYLLIAETPNKYWPRENHTTHAPNSSEGGLWCNHWLSKQLAYRRAVRNGRFDRARTDWDSSGWRGMGYYEMVKSLPGYRLIPERSRFRHRLFTALGLPASLIDPYPSWLLQKQA